MDKLKVLSLFSGIGAFEKALINIGVNYSLINYCEIDKYASKSYSVIHNVSENINLGDITKINIEKLSDFDLLTHGSPCQNFSIAGKQEGGDKGSDTRSSLMWNTVEVIKEKKPKYVVWENVKNVLSKSHIHNFEKYIEELNKLGYVSYYKVLNSKDFRIPQNRERIFVVSILGEHEPYVFPGGFKLELKLKDLLEKEVDEKFYLNKPFKLLEKEKSKSNCNQIAKVELNGHDYLKRVYDVEECSPTLPTGTGGNHEPKILDRCLQVAVTDGGYEQNNRVYSDEALCPTLSARDYKDAKRILENDVKVIDDMYKNRPVREYSELCPTLRSERYGLKATDGCRVRKLTPKEYWRLQAFTDEDFDKCVSAGISNSQLYKQAGNSITVTVLEEIFKKLFKCSDCDEESPSKQCN